MYEFHLTLLGSRYSEKLMAQGDKRPPDLDFMYEFHFMLLSPRYSVELTAQGAERPPGLLLRVRVPPDIVGLLGPLGAPAQGGKSASDLYFVYELLLTLLSSMHELTAQGDKAPPPGPLLHVRVPLHAAELPVLRKQPPGSLEPLASRSRVATAAVPLLTERSQAAVFSGSACVYGSLLVLGSMRCIHLLICEPRLQATYQCPARYSTACPWTHQGSVAEPGTVYGCLAVIPGSRPHISV